MSPMPMAMLDADDVVLMVNPAWAARAGGSVVAGCEALSMFAADSHSAVLKACAGQDGVAARFARASNPVQLRGVRLPDSAGVLLLVDDGAELARLQAAQAYSVRLQAVGQLVAGIAHDFNNLLAAMLGGSDAIADRAVDPETQADAANIRASGERGADMVRQLLALGGQQTLLPRAVAVNPAISALGAIVRRLLPTAIGLDLCLETPGRAIRIDPNQLDRALLNLVMNARDALVGGGCIRLATGHAILLEPSTAQPEQIPPGRYVTITISDDGPGIDQALQIRIFEPFFTTKSDHGGTGLGLATVLGIVRQSDGFLALRSAPGEGTCFTLYFPRHALPEATVAPVRLGVDGARRVLLVEDEDILRDLTAKVLTGRGWQVLAADCGEAALEMLGDAPIAAIVTDIMLPGMDGGALVQTLRGRLGQPDLPAILVSGYADVGLRRHATDTASLFLTKPYKMTALADHLDALTQTRA
jgi:two-component system cell cycle sensor histidine kinase/response regulator CckA